MGKILNTKRVTYYIGGNSKRKSVTFSVPLFQKMEDVINYLALIMKMVERGHIDPSQAKIIEQFARTISELISKKFEKDKIEEVMSKLNKQ